MTPIVITYYTPEYRHLLAPWRKALKPWRRELGEGYAYEVPTQHDWALNCGQKPFVLRRHLQEFPDNPPFYVDVDAEIVAPWGWDEFAGYDVAFRALAHSNGRREVLSGTLWLGPGSMPLLDEWCMQQERWPREWDQRNLQKALEHVTHLRARELDATWCHIVSIHDQSTASKTGNQVQVPAGTKIIQHQASRTMRAVVDSGSDYHKARRLAIKAGTWKPGGK
jgi:hypothetical protein